MKELKTLTFAGTPVPKKYLAPQGKEFTGYTGKIKYKKKGGK